MKILLIAGNGLSTAILNQGPVDSVDLSNLFAKGGNVSWPATGRPGFLSYEHCPNLWALGARQTISAKDSYEIIEQIITAVNACCLAEPSSLDDGIYIRAYRELVSYLRYLFVHYDHELLKANFYDGEKILEPIDWLLDAVSDVDVTDIDVVSFNYDAFLERILHKRDIQFSIPLLDERVGCKLRIHKPHGSITFCGKVPIENSAFTISHGGAFHFAEGGLDELQVQYCDLDKHFPRVGILPPAGESERYSHRWIRQIWDAAIGAAKSLTENDLVVIYGLSYWHVDRKEVDMLLGEISRKARVVSVNPRPNAHFEAVCCSLFRSYHSHIGSGQLKRMIK
ncbi:MAG: hypothetical protein OJK14_08360 [Achromobacter sp.]|uniref:hypothetical protein n=1 Tax=Achromobacter sp. TaxID=134375 RepID=UPI00258E582E|nr:hypothetical protein [Achromobacter sp.]MCW0207099.1 hypothetical protein [Achromobacter sp.]